MRYISFRTPFDQINIHNIYVYDISITRTFVSKAVCNVTRPGVADGSSDRQRFMSSTRGVSPFSTEKVLCTFPVAVASCTT